jgi:chemotaxis protein MotB
MSRRGEHGHHGGAWKVAYADFVTAMMALFIVLWILGSDAERKAAVAAYFRHPSVVPGEGRGFLTEEGMMEFEAAVERIEAERQESSEAAETPPEERPRAPITPEELAERGLLANSAKELEGLLNSSEHLRKLRGQITIELTTQGMRIQIQDLSQQPLFALGSSAPTGTARDLLLAIAEVLAPLPNAILLEGHTDSRPYSGQRSYTNWELSGERANAARRVLEEGGIAPSRIARVVGYADRRLLQPEDPESEHNRRISIIVCYSDQVPD